MPVEDIRKRLGLRPIVNASGTMTSLGASIVVPQAIKDMSAILTQFVEIDELQRYASGVISELTGAEAGFVTASCSAGVTLAVAGSMTGFDMAAVERLPDTTGLKNEVVIQCSHMINYGAPIEQAIRLAGAKVVPVGQANGSSVYHLTGALTERAAAAVYVVSSHVVTQTQIPLSIFADIAHGRGVPVIVDAASEYDLKGFLRLGADVALYSGHKFLGGPTSGIVAGSKTRVRDIYLQNRGIGRGMKIGKESIVGTMAALEAWRTRDHDGIRSHERQVLSYWLQTLQGRVGITTAFVPDPTGNPLDRLKVIVNPAVARISAWDLADRLASGDRPVIVRDQEIEHGYFFLDPCNLHPSEEQIVAQRLIEELDQALLSDTFIVTPFCTRMSARDAANRNWPN